MIAELTQWILETIRLYGGWSVFLGVLVEQVIVPIPSPAIIMGAGAILIPPGATWGEALAQMAVKIVLPGTIASTLGAWLGHAVGKWGGRVFVDRFERFLGFSWKDVESMGAHMSRTGMEVTTFFLRALPVVPLSLVSLVAGVLEAPLVAFLVVSFLGTVPRCFLLAILGWRLGAGALAWASGVNRYESLVSLLIVGLVIGGILYLRARAHRRHLSGK